MIASRPVQADRRIAIANGEKPPMTVSIDRQQLDAALDVVRAAEQEIERVATIGNHQWVRAQIGGREGGIWVSLTADRLVFRDSRGVRRCCYRLCGSIDEVVAEILDAAPARAKKP